MSTPPLSRRDFLTNAAFTGPALALAAPSAFGAEKQAAKKAAPAPIQKKYPIIAFSKPFAHLGPRETSDFVAEIGWDGIELPVRSKAGQIDPEKVDEELPKFVEAMQRNGKQVMIITTEITKLDKTAEKVLRATANLGIKKYRLGFAKYSKSEHPSKTIAEVGAALKDLAAFNKELGLQAGWQNHSGADYVGAPIWDLWTMMKDLDPKHMGMCYDIGHATLEGGLSWPIQARLMEQYFVAVFLKDFYFEKSDKGWSPRWCNFGAGSVHKSFLTWLKTTNFNGPLCQHHEYKELGKDAEMIANMKKDLATLREWLATA